MSLPRETQDILSFALREIIQTEVRAAYPRAGRNFRRDVEKKVEEALVVYLRRSGATSLQECNPKAFVCGFLARRG